MRFVSKYGRFGLQIQAQIEEAYASGLTRITQRGLYAMFDPVGLRPDERELAITTWSFNGLGQLEDEATTITPDHRIGRFDTEEAAEREGWDVDERVLVEQTLMQYCLTSLDVMLVAEATVPPPWPNYDIYAGGTKALVRKLIDEGYQLEDVLAYERTHQQRDDVILALEELLADPEALAELQPEAEEVLG